MVPLFGAAVGEVPPPIPEVPLSAVALNCPVPPLIWVWPAMPSRFTPYCNSLERSSSANFTRSRICFSIGGVQLQDCSPRSWRTPPRAPSRGPPRPCSTPCPLSAIESRELSDLMFSLGKDSLQHAPQRIQVQLHGDVVERALAGLAPDDHRGRAQPLAVQQDLARGDRARIDHVRIAGGDLADIGGIVDHDALADRQAQIFGALRQAGAGRSATARRTQRRSNCQTCDLES